jgi:hypothetical protein
MRELESPRLGARRSHPDAHSSNSLKEIHEDLFFRFLHCRWGVIYVVLAVDDFVGRTNLFFCSPKRICGGDVLKLSEGKCWRDCRHDGSYYFLVSPVPR